MRSDDVCLIVASHIEMFSWFDLLCTNHTHTPRLLTQRQELETRLPL